MWWLALPVLGLVGKAVYDAVTEDNPTSSTRTKSILEINLERLENQIRSHPERKIAIIGQPGAGKSSLLKNMTNGEVRPLPLIGAQTDATDWSRDQSCDLLSFYKNYAFSDVPGYDTSSHPMHTFSSHFPFKHFDVYIFVINGKLHSSDQDVFNMIFKSGKKIIIAKSFCDTLSNDEKHLVKDDIRTRLSIARSFPILFFSNRTKDGVHSVFEAAVK